MTSLYESAPPLTDEQQAVVDLPADAPTLVTAGPGAGKTHTLVRRVERLMERDRLVAGEILVLTFSRAAVRELKKRLLSHGEIGRYVRVQTFDAWAFELLLTVDAQKDWHSRSFDERIGAATNLIGSAAVNELLQDLKHVVVDEVQDLVGCRRRMVETLLATYECGFTVAGDSAQSIYGFQVSNSADKAKETNEFVRWLQEEFDSDLVKRHLSHNFRAASVEAWSALHLGPMLRESAESGEPESGEELFKQLWRQVKDTDILGELDDCHVSRSLLGYSGTTAVLCHTNGQALLVSESLHRHGVDHLVQRRAQDRLAPAWLAGLFRSVDDVVLSKANFGDHLNAVGLGGEKETLWDTLMKATRSRRRTLDLTHVREIVAEGRLPDELVAQAPADVVVSSVHRAKGLEFDRVLVVDPGPVHTYRTDPADLAEIARMLYVALTRPRKDLWRVDNPEAPPNRLKYLDRVGRWGRFCLRRKWMRSGLEVGPRDVYTEQPPGNNRGLVNASHFTAPAAVIQDYLFDKVRSGDDLTLERLQGSFSLSGGFQYLVTHGSQRFPVGVTSNVFSRAAASYIGSAWSREEYRWPAKISGVRVDAVETVVGSRSAGNLASLGTHGIWLAPRFTGLSHFEYAESNGEE